MRTINNNLVLVNLKPTSSFVLNNMYNINNALLNDYSVDTADGSRFDANANFGVREPQKIVLYPSFLWE